MDEQTQQMIQILSALSRSGASRSDIEKIMGNPMLGFLLGGVDPMTALPAQPGGGELMSRYAALNDPDMNVLISEIERGADQYEVQSAANRIFAEATEAGRVPFEGLPGFDDTMLKNLTSDLIKERTATAKASNADMFSKAGLSNPLEQYTLDTAPLTQEGSMLRMLAASQNQDREGRMAAAKASVDRAKKRAEEESKSEWDKKGGLGRLWATATMSMTGFGNPIERLKEKGKVSETTQALAKRAQADYLKLIAENSRETQRQEAFNRGLQRAIQESGATPFQSQVAQRLAMARLLK